MDCGRARQRASREGVCLGNRVLPCFFGRQLSERERDRRGYFKQFLPHKALLVSVRPKHSFFLRGRSLATKRRAGGRGRGPCRTRAPSNPNSRGAAARAERSVRPERVRGPTRRERTFRGAVHERALARARWRSARGTRGRPLREIPVAEQNARVPSGGRSREVGFLSLAHSATHPTDGDQDVARRLARDFASLPKRVALCDRREFTWWRDARKASHH